MSLRFSLALLAGACLVGPVQADRLLVAGPDGEILEASTADGAFQPYYAVGDAALLALAADGDLLFASDDQCRLHVIDAHDGTVENVFQYNFGSLPALAAVDGHVFAGTPSGFVLRIDPTDGQILDSYPVPGPVSALLEHRGMLFASAAGAIYTAPVEAPIFTYSVCFCFLNVQDLTVIDSVLVAADAAGTFAHIDMGTGAVLNVFGVGPLNAMVAQGGDLLIHSGNGVINRFAFEDGAPLQGGYTAPIEVDAMLVLPGTPVVTTDEAEVLR